MLKVQGYQPGEGWLNVTRAGETLADGWRTLAAYRRNYPADQYRLVSTNDAGILVPFEDDAEALALADEMAQFD